MTGVQDINGAQKLYCPFRIGYKQSRGGSAVRPGSKRKPALRVADGVAHGSPAYPMIHARICQAKPFPQSRHIVGNGAVAEISMANDPSGDIPTQLHRGNSMRPIKPVGYKDADTYQKDGDGR